MPTAPTYPGVYIEEVPSGVRTLTGVATSVAAFLGYFSRGPLDRAVRIFNFGDFERAFGGLRADSEAAYAIQQFFLNGGGQAYVVRTAATSLPATLALPDDAGADTLTLQALAAGTAGNALRVEVDYDAADQTVQFNLTVTDGTTTEAFSDLTPATAAAMINASSTLVEASGTPATRPSQTGTTGADIGSLVLPGGPLQNNDEGVRALVNGSNVGVVTWNQGDLSTPAGVRDRLRDRLRTIPDLSSATVDLFDGRLRIRTGTDDADEITLENDGVGTVVTVLGLDAAVASPQRLALGGGEDGEASPASAPLADGTAAIVLQVEAANEGAWGDAIAVAIDHDTAEPSLGTQFNLSVAEGGTTEVFRNLVMDPASPRYAVDVVNASSSLVRLAAPTLAPAATALPAVAGVSLSGGADGSPPGAAELIGTEADKTGMHALLDVDLFNLLCVPDTMRLTLTEAAAVAAAATALAERERAFYLLDAPQDADNPLDLPPEIETWLAANASLRHKNAALYYPRPAVADPLNDFRLREVAASGTMAGVYARTDGTRGVWKAPAGTEAVLRGVQRLEYTLTDAENGVLNPLGINALRTFPVFGTVAWGARTLDGADQLASEWKYVPIRRLALYIEESLFRGTQWVVFEPNDETLWAQIRLNVGTFLHTLFRQGAFQGTKPSSAYFVKCDAEVNPQADVDRGIVNVVVGFAPLKPAEFVVVKIQQMAGQLEL